ncbi:MAG: hypothetical protein QM763_22600 [Agriterribacter sp.]
MPLYTNSYTYRETSNEYITMDGSGRLWTCGLETYILEPGGKKFKYAREISPLLAWLNTGNEETYDIATTAKGWNLTGCSITGKKQLLLPIETGKAEQSLHSALKKI